MLGLKKLAAFGVVACAALVLSACNTYKSNTQSNPPAGGGDGTSEAQSQTGTGQVVTVTLGDNGFEPAQVTVKSGDQIQWVNNTGAKIQIGSDPHPVHTANKEVSGGQFVLDIEAGAVALVTVTKTGTWGYHDHLNAGVRGKVTVE